MINFKFILNSKTGLYYAANKDTLRGMAREFKPRTSRSYWSGETVTHNEWKLEECMAAIENDRCVSFGNNVIDF